MSHSQDLLAMVERIGDSIQSTLKSKMSWKDKLSTIITAVVPEVEKIGSATKEVGAMSGSEKKELAMQLIDELWFRYLDIKYIPNWIEKMIIKNASSKIIDLVVEKFNKLGIFKHS